MSQNVRLYLQLDPDATILGLGLSPTDALADAIRTIRAGYGGDLPDAELSDAVRSDAAHLSLASVGFERPELAARFVQSTGLTPPSWLVLLGASSVVPHPGGGQ